MALFDPAESTFTCQVNRSNTVGIKPGPPRQESIMVITIPLRPWPKVIYLNTFSGFLSFRMFASKNRRQEEI